MKASLFKPKRILRYYFNFCYVHFQGLLYIMNHITVKCHGKLSSAVPRVVVFLLGLFLPVTTWLDGEVSDDKEAMVEAHVASCFSFISFSLPWIFETVSGDVMQSLLDM